MDAIIKIMKTKFLLLCFLCFDFAYAGTPAINDLTTLYGVAIVLLIGIIAVPYLIKFVKNKITKSKKETQENDTIYSENIENNNK